MIRIELTQRPFQDDELNHIGEVVKSALHAEFAGRVLDPRALAASLIEGALGVLVEKGCRAPKSYALALLNGLDIQQIPPFSPIAPGARSTD